MYLQETVDLNLHVPETQPFAAKDTKYPITILFDSQHESTYPLIINAIDLLTSESQMPESILIGVQLNPNITQIYSLASHYANMLQDYKTALQFFELGLEYYPDYLDFYIEIIALGNITKDTKAICHYKTILSEKTKNSNHLSDSEKDELFNYLNEQ